MIPSFAEAVRALRAAGVANPRLDARLLWEHATNLSSSTDGGDAMPGGAEATFAALLARRRAREPLAYIVGSKAFWSLEFSVGPGVLVPRPETETVVEAVLRAHARSSALDIVDLGTGSGCILAALLQEYPAAHGVGVEASEPARAYARRNLARFASRARLHAGDWRGIEGHYDVVVSNPPYVRGGDIPSLAPEVAEWEPHAALDGGADGLDAYRTLAPLSAALLKSGGGVCFEVGQGQSDAVKHLFQAAGLVDVGAFPDLAGILRVVSGRKP